MGTFTPNNSAYSTKDYADFAGFCDEREKQTQWVEDAPGTARFEALEKVPIMALAYEQKYGCPADGVEETMDDSHSNLLLHFGGLTMPVGDTAVYTIMSRMGVRWAFWDRQHGDAKVLARDINSSFGMMRGTVKTKFADGMARAVLSGRYTPIPCPKVFGVANKFIADNYPEATFGRGFYSHSIVNGVWELEAYKDRFFEAAKKLGQTSIRPALFVQTSDVASSSIIVRPTLHIGDVYSPLLSKANIRHIGDENNVDARLNEMFEQAMASFLEAIDDVEKLNNIVFNNGPGALLRVFKEIGWPKKAKTHAVRSAEIFREVHEDDPEATAFEIYLSVVDAYASFCRENEASGAANAELEFRVSEAVARSLRIDYVRRKAEFDAPGNIVY